MPTSFNRTSTRSCRSSRTRCWFVPKSRKVAVRSLKPRKLISLRLPEDVIARWKATGPGWHTRMAERLSKVK
ncbi:MAG: BrnA antitoxin family protein [Gammaproteobacteria bacterium]